MDKDEKTRIVRIVASYISRSPERVSQYGWPRTWINCIDQALGELGWFFNDIYYAELCDEMGSRA